MATKLEKLEIEQMKQDINENSTKITKIGAHQENNYDSLQRIESKQDKFIYIFISASVGLLITIVMSR